MMKKILTILLFFVAVSASAQHLKFMGIPLDGSIDMFHSKLLAKGFTYDKEFNAQLNYPGVRAYEGIFCGYKADKISVYFDVKTKVVNGSKVVLIDNNQNITKKRYNEIKELLKNKYKGSYFAEGEQEGHEAFRVGVTKEGDTNCVSEEYIGLISLYITESTLGYITFYALVMEYLDLINSQKAESSKIDDL